MNIPSFHAHDCARVNGVLGLVGDKWTVLTVVVLRRQPLRFNELKRAVDGISQQMLTRTLRALERFGFVSRTVHPTVPPQVEYALTDLGLSLAEPLVRLGEWVDEHLNEVQASERAYFERNPDAVR